MVIYAYTTIALSGIICTKGSLCPIPDPRCWIFQMPQLNRGIIFQIGREAGREAWTLIPQFSEMPAITLLHEL
jgi:hypothetical protein